MDGISSAASIIAVIQLTGSLVKLCGGYIQEVRDARDKILTLQQAIASLQGTLQELQRFLRSNDPKTLPASSQLVSNITDCLSDLRALEGRLDPRKGKKLMRKLGLRALKWPLKRSEVEGVIQKIERYKSLFILSLNVDQTSLMVGVAQVTDRINQNMDLVKLEGVVEAGFESFSNRDEVQCLQGTRTKLLQQIMEWAILPSPKAIFWLNGMAGTGKSTISRTVARSLKDSNHLGANFFFKRGEGERGNAKKFFPTLVRQLVLRISELRPGVQKALHDDPDITSKSLSEQFEKLLFQPLLNLDQLGQQPQIAVIVIDALDECERDQDVRNIIRLLPRLQEAKAVRIRVFLTSRPEFPINLGFSKIADHDYRDLALHEIPEEVIEHDIELFLHDRFTKIQHDRNVSRDWPGDDVVQEIVTMSVPLFISAATICRYIEHSKLEPTTRLAELLKDSRHYAGKMDKTYMPVLKQLIDDEESDESEQQQLLHQFQKIVGAIILLAVPLSTNALALFLGIEANRISNLLDFFRSVLSVPSDRDLPVRILHLSFRDFLVQTKSQFHVDEPNKHKEIAFLCLEKMRSHLRNNICNLEGLATLRADINPKSLRQHLPPELQYSCRYWIHHLKQSPISSSEADFVLLFLHAHFLHWVEAMCLLGLVSEVVGMLNLLQKIELSVISEFLHDAKRFILKNRQMADDAPLQLYYSGLVFAPKEAIIRRKFEAEIPDWICPLPRVQETWSSELQTLEGHSRWVWSVAFSPDGALLASGSHDKTVRLWDTATGALQQTLEGHSDRVRSVAFSPDGALLASGSDDKTVRLWDMATGALQQTLEGHSDWVWSVAFSPDGALLASGSHDETVRLWDTGIGALQQTLEGHLDRVQSVVFSPDGALLASGSNNKTVRLWDTATGALQQTLEGHLNRVQSVVFSPDGALLASGSYDKTVRLWDIATGALQQTLEGHSDSVWSVAFSPDGALLVSGSHDKTVRLWDTATGALQQTLEGHSDRVRSVTFSPDGALLASSSDDETVRLWDTATDALQQTLEGHLDWVRSVAFSPDGALLASGSDDKTVRLWDTGTGALQQTLEGHPHWVWSVAFSPDGALLASGSHDKTVRLWETATGALQQTLEGHSDSVWSVAFSPDGALLASGSDDKSVRLWDTATGALQQTLEGHLDSVWSVAFSPDGALLASGSHDKTVRLWDTATGALQQTLEGHSDWVRSVAFSPDDALLASGSYDKTVRLWDTGTGALQQTLEGHSASVWSVAFSPDGALLASGSHDKTVRLWDTAIGALQQTLEGHSDWVRSVAFSPDGALLASGSDDKTVRLWDIGTGALQQTLEGHSDWVRSVAFSPDGALLASGSDDKTVRLWDTEIGALQQTLDGHLDRVQSVVFSPDGALLASGSYDKTVRLWDTGTGALQQTLKGHSDSVSSVAFSPDGALLASGSHDKTVRLWDTATGVLRQTLEGHSRWVWLVAFSPDGALLASGSDDKTVRLWDTGTGALQQTLEGHSDSVWSVAFSPDGALLASGSHDKTVRLWDTATGALQQTLRANGSVTDVEFDHDGSSLITNLGSLDIQCGSENHATSSNKANPAILLEQQWIKLNGKNVLWLPPGSRPSCSAINGNLLALGHATGLISFIGFHV